MRRHSFDNQHLLFYIELRMMENSDPHVSMDHSNIIIAEKIDIL
jgi:hypothetical protein